jgi:hypothetical protein
MLGFATAVAPNLNKVNAEAWGHLLNQSHLVKEVGRFLPVPVYGAVAASRLARDVFETQGDPEARKTRLTRDAIVLPMTIGGTVLATSLFMPPEQSAKALGQEGVALLKQAYQGLEGTLEKKLGQEGAQKAFKALADNANQLESRAFNAVVGHLSAKAKDAKTLAQDLKQFLPIEEAAESFGDKFRDVIQFSSVGAGSVAAGVAAGLVANRVTGENDKQHTANILKEAAFQSIANIFSCAVGMFGGIHVAENMLGLSKTNQPWLRTGIIGAGLAAGIVGGGVAANRLGQRYITPLVHWSLRPKTERTWEGLKSEMREEQEKARLGIHDRHVELVDIGMHADDLPVLLNLSLPVFGPAIPPFFEQSAWRAATGYRSSQTPTELKKLASVPLDRPSTLTSQAPQVSLTPLAPDASSGNPNNLPTPPNPWASLSPSAVRVAQATTPNLSATSTQPTAFVRSAGPAMMAADLQYPLNDPRTSLQPSPWQTAWTAQPPAAVALSNTFSR